MTSPFTGRTTLVLISLLFVVPTSALAQATGSSDRRATCRRPNPSGRFRLFSGLKLLRVYADGYELDLGHRGQLPRGNGGAPLRPSLISWVGESASSFNFGLIPFGWAVYNVFGTVPPVKGRRIDCETARTDVKAQVEKFLVVLPTERSWLSARSCSLPLEVTCCR